MIAYLIAILLQAAPATPRPSIITNPDWVRRPTGEDLARFYPKAAANLGLGGSATISCAVTELGALDECSVAAEQPTGAGFGEAAIALSSTFKMRPQTRDGVPVRGGTVRIPIRFMMPGPMYPPVEVAGRCYGLAAATAEVTPTTEAWKPVLLWQTVVSALMVQQEKRPSQVQAVLTDAQGVAKKDYARGWKTAPEWERCELLAQAFGRSPSPSSPPKP